MNQIFPTNRRGVSLIELIVIMSAASIILSLSAGLIHRVMHAETKARSLAAIERTALRLADAVRRDVHSATSAVTESAYLADGAFLRLETSSSGRIEYRREEQTIHRVQGDSDRIIAHEQFIFPSDFDLQIRMETPALVVLTLTPHQATSAEEPEDTVRSAKTHTVDLQVVAALQRGGR